MLHKLCAFLLYDFAGFSGKARGSKETNLRYGMPAFNFNQAHSLALVFGLDFLDPTKQLL